MDHTLNARVPMRAEIVSRIQESDSVFTLRLRLVDESERLNYCFQPGQFNMVYLYGVGEVAISIVSDAEGDMFFSHTIRAVGRVTKGLEQLKQGDELGVRGPFGRGWPMGLAEEKDLVVVTGGIGCAPVVSAIESIRQTRERYGKLLMLEGVYHHKDLIYSDRFQEWDNIKNSELVLCCDDKAAPWPWHTDKVTKHLDQLEDKGSNTVAFLCGPEGMMIAAATVLEQNGVREDNIWLSLERNMQCGDGFCGHCQLGTHFVCREGPVFSWREIREPLTVRGL